MALGNVKIFNGQGRLLQLTQDGNVYRTTMHLPKVSVGLSEVAQLFILESCLERVGVSGVKESIARPFSDGQDKLTVDVEGDTQFSLFSVYIEDKTPYISTSRNAVFSFDTPTRYATLDQDGLSCLIDPNKEPIAIHLAYSPTKETASYGTIKVNCTAFSLIVDLYAESEDEDERFASMLANFGRHFAHIDELMLRNSDIHEDLPDWSSINNKRKELLLSGDEIYSNIGSVKGLLNALKFFGYQDLVVKEFWLNVRKDDIDNGKLISNELGLDYRMIDAGGYKKTDRIGLFYPINKVTDKLDKYGLPIVVDAFMFSQEEILIKLFALREKLRKDFLPPYVRITDITGEGVYFAHYKLNAWSDKNKHVEVQEGEDIFIKISQSVGYLQDLRRLIPAQYPDGLKLPAERFDDLGDQIYTNTVAPYTSGQMYSASAISTLVESIELFTKKVRYHYPWIGKENLYEGEEPNVLVGYPLILECVVPPTLWSDINGASFGTIAKRFTWKNISLRQNYEIEWSISRVGGGYNFTYRGVAENFMKLPHFIPLEGLYDIKCRLINMDNHSSLKLLEKAITVYQKNLEIIAVTKYSENIKNWKDFNFAWSVASGTLACPAKTDIQDPSLPGVLLDPYNYKQEIWKIFEKDVLEKYSDVEFYNNRLGHTTRWNNTDATWGECKKLSFKETKFCSEYLGGFKFPLIEKGDILSVGKLGSYTVLGTSVKQIVSELNSTLTEGVERFHYTSQPDGIKADAKIAGPYGWNFIELKKAKILLKTQSWEIPDWLEHSMLKVMDKHVDVPQSDWFLDAPISDIIAGKVHDINYWIERGVISKKDGRGSLPSFAGSSSWGDSGMKVYNNPFKSPQHVPIFILMDSSEIYGKHDILWNIKKVLHDGTETNYMTVVDSSYLVLRLKDEATYTVEVELLDSNNNKVYKRMPGFIEIIKG